MALALFSVLIGESGNSPTSSSSLRFSELYSRISLVAGEAKKLYTSKFFVFSFGISATFGDYYRSSSDSSSITSVSILLVLARFIFLLMFLYSNISHFKASFLSIFWSNSPYSIFSINLSAAVTLKFTFWRSYFFMLSI